jgi:two-component system, sensor histidine kinase YesM
LENKGLLLLKFQLVDKKLAVIITDNGIGLTKSKDLKTINQKVHISRGLNNTNERIALLNDLYKKEITFQIKEKNLPETGTIVEINFPLMNSISG